MEKIAIRSSLTAACDISGNTFFSRAQFELINTFIENCLRHTSQLPGITGDEEDGGVSIDWLSDGEDDDDFLSFGMSIWNDEGSGHILTGMKCVEFWEKKGTPEETLPEIEKMAQRYFQMKKNK